MKDVQPRQEIVHLVEAARGQALDERVLRIRLRIRIHGNQCIGIGSDSELRAGARELDDQRAAFYGRHSSDSQLRVEPMGEVVALPPGMQWSSVPSLRSSVL